MKELQITALKDGVVIDHIPSKSTLQLVKVLKLKDHDHVVTVAFNLKSNTLGKKGLIKISGRELTKHELDVISIMAPSVTVNIIKDYEVVNKLNLEVSETITNVIKCNNYNCISNHEQTDSIFTKIEDDVTLFKCFYCEREYKSEEIKTL